MNSNCILSRYTGNLASLTSNLLSNPVSFVKDNLDNVMNQYSYEKLTLGIRHKHPIYYLGNGLVIYGSVVYKIVRKFETFPVFGELFVRPVIRFIDDSIINHQRKREESSTEEFDRENIFESHEEMVNPRIAHIETLFSFLAINKLNEIFSKTPSSSDDNNNTPISILHCYKPNDNSFTYFKDFTRKIFSPSYTPSTTSSELYNLNINSNCILSKYTRN